MLPASDAAVRPATPRIMGVLNVTPDSFSDGGAHHDVEAAVAHGRLLVAQGADLVDVGGESTRPGAPPLDTRTEQARVVPVVRMLAADGIRVSIDTMHAGTAAAALDAGAVLVNDVSGGLADPDLAPLLAQRRVDLVAMHWRGPSRDMQRLAQYDDVVTDVVAELRARVDALVEAGVDPARIVLDPGIGFSKTAEHNWRVLDALPVLTGLGHRLLLGASRKRFLADVPGVPGIPGMVGRDQATAATSLLAAQAGVWAVRVHDVPTTRIALGVWASVRDAAPLLGATGAST